MHNKLKTHWFNVQTNKFTTKENTGALNREVGWSNLKIDVRGQVQQVNKGDALEQYNIKVAGILYIIFFDDVSFEVDAGCRFIINKKPKFKVPEHCTLNDVKILEFMGFNQGYIDRIDRKNVLEIYAEHNKRWSL